MTDAALEQYILDHFRFQHPHKVTQAKIIMNVRDLPELMKEPFATYDYSDPDIYYMGKRIVVYNTLEEFYWQVILQ